MKKGIFDLFKEQRWPYGNTSLGERETNRCLQVKSRYEDFLAGRSTESSDEPDLTDSEQAFAAEADLRDFLANNLGRIEPGLHLFQRDDRRGVEFPVDDGRIDILAVDRTGKFVVIELKLSMGRNRALGQLLYYMGWVDNNLGNGPCRGMVIAKEITDDLIIATQRVGGVSLYKYYLSVSVERVTGSV
jgi:RecB family endonuclease NucS